MAAGVKEAGRKLLQLVSTRGAIRLEHCQEFMKDSLEEDDLELENVREHVNMELKPIGLEMRKAVYDYSGDEYYAMVNLLADDAMAKLASSFKDEHVYFFRQVVDYILENEDGCVYRKDMNEFKKNNKKQYDANEITMLVRLLLEKQWLHDPEAQNGVRRQRPENRYFLGVRSTLDLMNYIKKKLSDAGREPCPMCQDPVVHGPKCSNPKCSMFYHTHCLARWFETLDRQKKKAHTCANCQREWADDDDDEKDPDA